MAVPCGNGHYRSGNTRHRREYGALDVSDGAGTAYDYHRTVITAAQAVQQSAGAGKCGRISPQALRNLCFVDLTPGVIFNRGSFSTLVRTNCSGKSSPMLPLRRAKKIDNVQPTHSCSGTGNHKRSHWRLIVRALIAQAIE